jgi:hypothetical protein
MITGTVYDATTGETLPGANLVWLNVDGQFSGSGTASDVNGYFSMPSAPPGCGTIQASYIGYKNEIITPESANESISFQLSEQATNLQEVEIIAKRPVPYTNYMIYAGIGVLALGILVYTLRK